MQGWRRDCIIHNTRSVLSPSSGGQQSKFEVSAGLVPSEGREGESFMPPSFWWLLAIFGILWLVEASPRSLPSSSHGVLCVCVTNFPLSIRIPVTLH